MLSSCHSTPAPPRHSRSHAQSVYEPKSLASDFIRYCSENCNYFDIDQNLPTPPNLNRNPVGIPEILAYAITRIGYLTYINGINPGFRQNGKVRVSANTHFCGLLVEMVMGRAKSNVAKHDYWDLISLENALMIKHSIPLTELLSQQFFQAASDAVVIIDEDGAIVHFNSQTEILFGYSRKELLNQPMEILVPERLRARHIELRRHYFRNPLPRAMGNKLVLAGQRKDGTEFPIDLALSPLPTEYGLYVAAAVRDITVQRRLENELRQQACNLANADIHKNHFLATLSHEMRSPLAAIAYTAEYLRHGTISVEERKKAAEIMLEGANFVRQILNDLDELSLIQRGELPVHKAPTDLVEVARLAIDMVRPLIEQQGHVLEVIMPSIPLYILGDATRLAQIITNLLNNAARYTPKGGHISLALGQQEQTIVVKVMDNGIGIPPEMLARVFDLFTRLDGAKRRYTNGLGIGLAFVQRLVEAHGGSVQAFSEGQDRGSMFVVRLPLADIKPTEKADHGLHPALPEKVLLAPLCDPA